MRRAALPPPLLSLATLLLAGSALAGSDVPPKGPTWERDLLGAHEKALRKGVPIFLYFTKTY